MRDSAKQIINYWYSLECLQPKEVPKYKALPKKYIKELIFSTDYDRTTIYQQSVINPFWKNSHVSMYVVPLPNYSYNYSIIDEIIPEAPGGIQNNPAYSYRKMRNILFDQLERLTRLSENQLINERYKKYRKIGEIYE